MLSNNLISSITSPIKYFSCSIPEKLDSTNSNSNSMTFDFAAHSSNLLLFQQIMGSPGFLINFKNQKN